jgi:prepilin-type N-terminal cleavage/methylation domain-containing protein
MQNSLKRGFTLVELLIVIAILAVLAAAVVIVLNPGELLAQARDSQRLSDMDTLKNALAIYVAQAASPDLGATCGGTTKGCCNVTSCVPGFTGGVGAVVVRTGNGVDGTGWIPVNLASMPGGSPIPFLPMDPTNSTTYFYGFINANTSPSTAFELNARLESQKHRGKMVNDGGDDNTCSTYLEATCWYEVGTDSALDL